jgi:transposase
MVPITVRLRMDTLDNAITKPVHRLEVFTGAGRRRTWSAEDKARIVAEIVASDDSVSALGPTARTFVVAIIWLATGIAGVPGWLSHAEELQFVPAVLDPSSSARPPSTQNAAAPD